MQPAHVGVAFCLVILFSITIAYQVNSTALLLQFPNIESQKFDKQAPAR